MEDAVSYKLIPSCATKRTRNCLTQSAARRYTDERFSDFMRAVKSIEDEGIDPGIAKRVPRVEV